ncbi:hypothetical protein GCM10027429_32730 [Marivirga atlantica]|jgi:hypothetical protein|uniref:Uncharacterized protein n=1 Tax=Marivirga atlantica TaxID=1548457 RepID=A0A937DKE3_9BACT|nr:hypothetical protein [Marivirga atlantica]MBL0766850.1 hypothetical protein [Marivirga atlantica]
MPFLSVGQEDDPFDYGQEFLFGVSTSTNSGFISGAFFRYSAKQTDRILQTYGIEFANIRHPQERKVQSNFYGSNIYEGKENYLMSMRLMYGYDALLFKKADRKGVQINAVMAGGPSVGFISPYYLRGESGELLQYSEYLSNPQGIIGAANYFAGFGEMDATVGLNLRLSLLFEFGTFKSSITGFEVGGVAEYFAQEVEIVPTGTKNYNFYPALFLSILFGSRK